MAALTRGIAKRTDKPVWPPARDARPPAGARKAQGAGVIRTQIQVGLLTALLWSFGAGLGAGPPAPPAPPRPPPGPPPHPP